MAGGCYPDRQVHAVIVAGGAGERLGRRVKADLELGGRRLLDLVWSGLAGVVAGRRVVVAPENVTIPDGAIRTLEQPPGGGPLAGISAGLAALNVTDPTARVLVCAVDSPGMGRLAVRLVQALDAAPAHDGAVIHGGEPVPFRQYLQACYRLPSLTRVLAAAGELRNRGVGRTLRVLDLVEVPAAAEDCRDIDSFADLAWWTARLGPAAADPGSWAG